MFFLLAVVSMFGYALQTALLVREARNMDALSLVFYRSASFAFTLFPLLIGVSGADIVAILRQWPLLLLTGIAGGAGLGLMYSAYRFLAMSVTQAFHRTTSSVLVVFIGWVFLGETLGGVTLLLISIIVISAMVMGLMRNCLPHLDLRSLRGTTYALLTGIMFAITSYTLTALSRSVPSLAVGYFWEMSIALGAMLLITVRMVAQGKRMERISLRRFGRIVLYSSSTLIGTGCFALAVRMGPMAVANAIGSTSLAVTSLLGWWWYRERLRPVQWVAMAVMIGGTALLRLL